MGDIELGYRLVAAGRRILLDYLYSAVGLAAGVTCYLYRDVIRAERRPSPAPAACEEGGQEAQGPAVSAVIVSWNTRPYPAACLRSLSECPDLAGSEIVVVDNASGDGSATMVERDVRRVRLIRNESNAGFAAATNRGIRESRGRHVLLPKPDTELRRGAVDAMLERLRLDGAVGLVVDAGDAAALARAVAGSLERDHMRARIAARGEWRARRLSWDRVAGAYLELFRARPGVAAAGDGRAASAASGS